MSRLVKFPAKKDTGKWTAISFKLHLPASNDIYSFALIATSVVKSPGSSIALFSILSAALLPSMVLIKLTLLASRLAVKW